MGDASYLLAFVFPFAMVYAAATDLLTMRIANAVSLGIAAAFIVAATWTGMPFEQVLMHLASSFAVLLFGMLLFGMRLLGGGDAKLLAAATLWIGFDHLLPFLAWVTVFGGILAFALLAYRTLPVAALPLPGWALRLHEKGEGMPYGIAITAGALAVYPMTAWPMLLS